MTRSVVQNLLVLGVSVLVCLLAAEAFFRLFPQFLGEEAQLRLHWQAIRDQDLAQSTTVPDRRFGYLYRPHFTGRTSRSDLDFTFHTDEHGFRNPSPWPDQADVVVVGDSLAFSYGVDDEETWPRLVNEAMPTIDVINLGLPGLGPQQYLRLLESFGLPLHPKLVLFMLFTGNDLKDADDFQHWLDTDSKVPYKRWRQEDGQPRGLDPLRQLLERSRLVTFLRGARRALISTAAGGTVDFGNGGRVQLTPAFLQPEVEMARPDNPTFELVMATIERARTVTRQDGGHFLVLLMPTKEEVYLPRIGETAPPLAGAFKAALDQRGIPCLDLTPAFLAHASDLEPLFYKIDGHPNADGYRLIAKAVTDHLKEFGPRYGLPLSAARAEHPD